MFSFSDYQVLPWQWHCTKGELHICGKGMRAGSHTFQALQLWEQASAVVTRKKPLQLWKSDTKYLEYSQFCASSCTSWYPNEKNSKFALLKSPEKLHFRAAENICCLLSVPVVAFTSQRSSLRPSAPNSQLLSKDTCLLFLAIVTAGDAHFYLKNKTGAKHPAELEL